MKHPLGSHKLFRASFAIGLLIILAIINGGCRQRTVEAITVAGSTTVLTVAQASSEEFMKEFPQYRIYVQGGGSSTGIEAAYTGAADIGTSSRDLKGDELKFGLKTIPLAFDAIAVIVNPQNKVKSLSLAQLKDIYTGKVTNWKQLGGEDLEIVLVNRDEASGTREAFAKKVLGEADFIKDAVIQPGNGQVRSIVSSAKAGIGYLSLGYVNSTVKIVAVDGIDPSIENIRNGKYPLHRKLYLLTKSRVTPLTEKFIDYILSPRTQKEIIGVEFVPIIKI